MMPTLLRRPRSAEPEQAPPARSERSDHGRGVHATWTYTLGSIVFVVVALASCLVLMSAAEFSASRAPLDGAVLGAVLASAAVQLRYCWFLRRGRGGGLPGPAWTGALLAPAVAAWVLGLFSPGLGVISTFSLWMALCLMACLLPTRQRWLLLAAGLAAIALHPLLTQAVGGSLPDTPSGNVSWLLICYGVMFPVMLLSGLWWWEIVVELDRHRRTAAELAVAQERLRFAADLHDIQGHHLQVIALKSELAERMLDLDLEAARVNIHETRIIANQALEETRLLVSGYREISLDDELQNAREVLTAAGAGCTLDLDPLPAGTDLRRALAMTVREATTNILRHSEAAHVTIRFRETAEAYTLEILNDGVVGAGSGAAGTGLAGLRERLAPVGGEIDTVLDPAAGQFSLTVCVPTRVGARA
ncbi:sensor histidine kinase [Microterricola viridarii]|nr:histidine kinase [Microterricola viridarii]